MLNKAIRYWIWIRQSFRRLHCKEYGHDWQEDARLAWSCRRCGTSVWVNGETSHYLSRWTA